MSQSNYPFDTFRRFSEVLEFRAGQMGAKAFSLGSEIVNAAVAVDEAGPLTWALAIHADALARLGGLSPHGANMLPFTMVEDDSSPYGNLCVMQDGSINASKGMALLDSALEHCICVGMKDLGYTPEEWLALPSHQQVIPIEPYLENLQTQWVTEALESNDRVQLVINLPNLYTKTLLQQTMLDQRMGTVEQPEKPQISRAVSFGSMR